MSEPSGQEVWRPGQDCQAVATARVLGQDVDKIHGAPWGVVGTLGDSICYIGVPTKVDAIQAAMGRRIAERGPAGAAASRPPTRAGSPTASSTAPPQMRYSLIGRETTNDGLCAALRGQRHPRV